jgi:excisionase family DNA binding protein
LGGIADKMKLYTVKEAAEVLCCSQSFLYARLADGSLAHYRLGKGQGGIRISDEQLQMYLAERERGGREKGPPAPRPKPVRLKHLQV